MLLNPYKLASAAPAAPDLLSDLVALFQNGSLADATGRGNDLTASHVDPAAPTAEWNEMRSFSFNQLTTYLGTVYRARHAIVGQEGNISPSDDLNMEIYSDWTPWTWSFAIDQDESNGHSGYNENELALYNGIVYRKLQGGSQAGEPNVSADWVINAPQSVASGLANIPNAIQFNGVDNFASRASTADLQLGGTNFTVACWVKRPIDEAEKSFVEKGIEYALKISPTQVEFFGLENASVAKLGSLNDGGYHFFCVVFESGTVSISIDSGSAESWIVPVNSGADDFSVGKSVITGYSAGQFSQIAIYKRAFTAEEVTALFNEGDGVLLEP